MGDDEETAYFGSQSSGGGGAETDESGIPKRSNASNVVIDDTNDPSLHGKQDNPVSLMERLALRGIGSSLSASDQGRKLLPFQKLSGSYELNTSNNGSRVNLNLQLAETLIKDAIRTASFDAGYSEVDFSNVSVDLCLDSNNSAKPVQLNLTHKQHSSCDTTPVRSFAETNGDLTDSENIASINALASRISSEKNARIRNSNIEPSLLNNPLHIDANSVLNFTSKNNPNINSQLPRNSSVDSLKTTTLSVVSSVSPSSVTSAHSQSIQLASANRNRFYQFKSKEQSDVTDQTNQSVATTSKSVSNSVQVPSKLSSGVAMTASTSSTSISKLRLPNIKTAHHHLDDHNDDE